MRAFVAGATGYTGREVVRLLAQRGIETHMHVRPDSSQRDRWQSYAATHGATLDTTAWRDNQFEGHFSKLLPTHIFALLGTTKARAKKVGAAGGDKELNTYESVDFDLTKELLDAGLTMGSPPRFVYLSSAGSGPNAKGPYLKVRHRIEQDLEECYKSYVSIRPSFITGADRDDDRPFERVGAAVGNMALKAVGVFGASRLRDRYRSISNIQLARAVVHYGLLDATSAPVIEGESLHEV